MKSAMKVALGGLLASLSIIGLGLVCKLLVSLFKIGWRILP